MDQLRVTQECNQQGDNCNDIITGGHTEKIGKKGLATNKAMARPPSQPVANLSLLVQRVQTRQLFPVQTSPSRCPM